MADSSMGGTSNFSPTRTTRSTPARSAIGRGSGSGAVGPFWATDIRPALPVRRRPAEVRHRTMSRPFVLPLHQPEVPAESRVAQVGEGQKVRERISVDLNRVEGDLEVRLDAEDQHGDGQPGGLLGNSTAISERPAGGERRGIRG